MNTPYMHTVWINPAYLVRIYIDRPYVSIDGTHQYPPMMHCGGVYAVVAGEYTGSIGINGYTKGLGSDALAIVSEYEQELECVKARFDEAETNFRLNYKAPVKIKRPWWRRVF